MHGNTIGDRGADSVTQADLLHEIQQLREGLWACYTVAGGDPHHYDPNQFSSEDLIPLVLDCVRDLRGFFDAARRDLR